MIRNYRNHSSNISDLICVCMIVVAMYLLMPRFWEPSGETWKYWMSARILKDTGGFPIIYHGPLYIAYLQFFLLFKFPLSLHMEYFVTHLFCYTTIFFLLRSMIARIPALLLLCAWIPIIATIEGSAVVAGIGFMALYLYQMSNAHGKAGIIPPSLGAAALCHSSYIPFFIGHVFGSIMDLWRSRRSLKETWKDWTLSSWLMSSVLITIFLFTLFFPSQRWDHNYVQMDQKYVPIPLKDPLTVGFFQAGNYRYMVRSEPKAEWVNCDWYFTHEKAYAGATTIPQAIVRKPLFVARNMLDSLLGAVNCPLFFIFGADLTGKLGGLWLSIISWAFFLLGFHGMIRRFITTNSLSLAGAMTMGVVSIFTALSLVWFAPRYKIVLLPAMFFIFSHVGLGYQSVKNRISNGEQDKYLQQVSCKRSLRKKMLLCCGIIMILSGFFLNEKTLEISINKNLIGLNNNLLMIFTSDLLMILIVDLLVILTGILIITKTEPAFFSIIVRNIFRRNDIIVSVIALAIMGMAFYSNAQSGGIQQILSSQYLLNGSKPVSIMKAHQELMKNLNQQTKVLSHDETWIKAFADVNLDNVYHLYSLPPFPDTSGDTENALNELNMILVRHSWPNAEAAMSTQSSLRYYLHVEPFLQKARTRGWLVKEIEGYGKMYYKPEARHPITGSR